MGKKDCCAVFGCNNDGLFSKKYTVKFSFCAKLCTNTERVPPGHPIILLKSNKFNMAAILVKRSIDQQISNVLMFEQILSSSTI